MKEYLKGTVNPEREDLLNSRLPEIAKLCSERERAAEEAEELKKVEFMKKISNVTSFGMFVELENTIEGLVRISSLEDDYYVYNDKMIGERSRKVYRIGIKADVAARRIEFTIVVKMMRRL